MEIILVIGIFLNNIIWFIFYKELVNKCIEIRRQHIESLTNHRSYLIESEKNSKEFTKSLNETVRLVLENANKNNRDN